MYSYFVLVQCTVMYIVFEPYTHAALVFFEMHYLQKAYYFYLLSLDGCPRMGREPLYENRTSGHLYQHTRTLPFSNLQQPFTVIKSLKFKLISSKKFVFGIVFSLIIFQLLLNAPNLFFRIKDDIVFNPFLNQTQNIRICTATKQLVLVRDLLDELVRSVIPLIIQVSSSIIIIINVRKYSLC